MKLGDGWSDRSPEEVRVDVSFLIERDNPSARKIAPAVLGLAVSCDRQWSVMSSVPYPLNLRIR